MVAPQFEGTKRQIREGGETPGTAAGGLDSEGKGLNIGASGDEMVGGGSGSGSICDHRHHLLWMQRAKTNQSNQYGEHGALYPRWDEGGKGCHYLKIGEFVLRA